MTYLIFAALIGALWLQAFSRFADKRRIEVLKRLSISSNPRFGVNHRIIFSLEQLREFFDADKGFVILQEGEGTNYSIRQVARQDTCLKEEASSLAADLAQLLMGFPANGMAIYQAPRHYRSREAFTCYDVESGQELDFQRSSLEKVVAFIGSHFVSIPLICNRKTVGRIFIASRSRPFLKADVDFIFHVTGQIAVTIKDLEAATRLAAEAADEERRRIASDIHDSIVQPYVGLQMALEVMRQKVAAGEKPLLRDVDLLDRMCREGTQELRSYIHALRNGRSGENSLIPAVHRFASKFSAATGIEVKVESSPDFSIHDGLAAHVFQMTAEGLSNVHRHTQAHSALIRLGCDKQHVLLQIENSGDASGGKSYSRPASPAKMALFTPRSISERASSLGGTVNVETHPDGGALISVDIPL